MNKFIKIMKMILVFNLIYKNNNNNNNECLLSTNISTYRQIFKFINGINQ